MRTRSSRTALVLVVATSAFAGTLLCVSAARATDVSAAATAGRRLFQQQCALCHSAQPNDNGGARGPNLFRVFGRRAAADPAFSYTPTLRDARLTWDKATLNRFLQAPTTMVPGNAMVVAVPDEQQRENIIAYFRAVKEGTFRAAAPRAFRLRCTANTPKPANESGDWKLDAPGRMHRINLADLPAPFTTPSASNFPRLVPRPARAPPRSRCSHRGWTCPPVWRSIRPARTRAGCTSRRTTGWCATPITSET